MLSIIISGCNGYMGRTVAAVAGADPGVTVTAGFDVFDEPNAGFPVYTDPELCTERAGAVVDFSSPAAIDGLLRYCLSSKTPLVLCTTGHSSEQLDRVLRASEQIPVFKSGNMSLGINLLAELVKRACEVLGGAFDVEVVERHHRRKVDAPSGTALMLADAAASALPYNASYVYERRSDSRPRGDHDIGISSVRGGTIVGDHEVIFAGLDEVIEFRHSASSRDVFAVGAVKAAAFMAGVAKPGMYDMRDVLASC